MEIVLKLSTFTDSTLMTSKYHIEIYFYISWSQAKKTIRNSVHNQSGPPSFMCIPSVFLLFRDRDLFIFAFSIGPYILQVLLKKILFLVDLYKDDIARFFLSSKNILSLFQKSESKNLSPIIPPP